MIRDAKSANRLGEAKGHFRMALRYDPPCRAAIVNLGRLDGGKEGGKDKAAAGR